MLANQIRELVRARPFHPFELVINDGRRLQVAQPYRLAIAPNDQEICFAAPPLGFERIKIANVSEVVANGR